MGQRQAWPKNRDELKERITCILDKIPKPWFKNTFASLPKSWEKVIKGNGKMSDFFISKRKKTL